MQEIVSLMDVFMSIRSTRKAANTHTPYCTCLGYHRFSPIFTTVIPQSILSFTPPPPQSTPTPPPTTKATNPPSTLPDFTSVFQFNNRISALEKDVSELKKDDPLKTQVTALIDEYLDARLGATKDEFMNYLSSSITARVTEQVKIQLP
ncbi:hypothetical protein Tco_1182385 [Tanacetum coccineum]